MKHIQGRPVRNQAQRLRVDAKPPLHKAELLMFIIAELSPQNSAEHRSFMKLTAALLCHQHIKL